MEIPTHSGLFFCLYVFNYVTYYISGRFIPRSPTDSFAGAVGKVRVFHARVEMASARVVGAAKSLDARVKAIIQAVPYCFLESREHELGTV